MIKIVTLVDNVTYKKGLKAEHGLSFLIKTPGFHILFDTGQSGLLLENAAMLGEDLTLVKHVVISHGHYDHTGGLKDILTINKSAKVWIHENALAPKFSISTGDIRPIGMSLPIQHFSQRVGWVTQPVEIEPGFWLLPNIARTSSFETQSNKLLIKQENQYQTDPFNDELVLYFHTPNNLCLVSGCAHRGIINTIEAVKKHSGLTKFEVIIGGTHLNGAPAHRIQATIQSLQAMTIAKLLPNHCTGISAFAQMQTQLQCEVVYAQAGNVITIDEHN